MGTWVGKERNRKVEKEERQEILVWKHCLVIIEKYTMVGVGEKGKQNKQPPQKQTNHSMLLAEEKCEYTLGPVLCLKFSFHPWPSDIHVGLSPLCLVLTPSGQGSGTIPFKVQPAPVGWRWELQQQLQGVRLPADGVPSEAWIQASGTLQPCDILALNSTVRLPGGVQSVAFSAWWLVQQAGTINSRAGRVGPRGLESVGCSSPRGSCYGMPALFFQVLICRPVVSSMQPAISSSAVHEIVKIPTGLLGPHWVSFGSLLD
jgi:hypothetical protein